MGTQVVTVNDVLDGHVALDLQCLDRIFSTPTCRSCRPARRSWRFVGASGLPVCFSCVVQPDRTAVRRAVAPFAQANDIPWVKFGKDDVGAKLELMRPHLDRQAATG